MPSSSMRTAVLQTTVIGACIKVFKYQFTAKIFDSVWENEGYLNMTQALNASKPLNSTTSKTPGQLTLDAGNATNETSWLNQTVAFDNGTAFNNTLNETFTPPESFYGRTFPREIVAMLLLSALQYWWLIWLERMLPARPRYRDLVVRHEEKVEESEDREEEVVKKWIAQGRVHRASLNWRNTFLKWVLQMTIGISWLHLSAHIITTAMQLKFPIKSMENLKTHIFLNFIGHIFSVTPLYYLLAFILIPARKQIVFVAAAQLVTTIFFATALRVFAGWAVNTNFVQTLMRNVTDASVAMNDDPESYFNSHRKHRNEL